MNNIFIKTNSIQHIISFNTLLVRPEPETFGIHLSLRVAPGRVEEFSITPKVHTIVFIVHSPV